MKLHLLGDSPWLTSAKLKLVDGCNLRCFMCDYWRGQRGEELSTEEVLDLLGQLGELGCEKLHFSGGELLLRSDVLLLLERATELSMRCNLTTNGTLLDREMIRALVKLPLRSLTLSIDAPSAKIHDAIRGQKGAHKKTTRALDRLLASRGNKTRVRLNTVLSRRNVRGLVEMGAYLRDRDIDEWLLIPMDPWTDNSAALRAEDIRYYNAHVAPALADTVSVAGFDPFVYGGEEDVQGATVQRWARGFYRANRCHVPWFHTLVDARGDVYSCCMGHRRSEALGNVRSSSLREIWNGERYRALRCGMRESRPEICHRCDDFLAENRAFAALEGDWRAAP